jgi:5'-nucleotidase
VKRAQKSILVVNDDGVYGEGLKPLAKALSRWGRVTVVVPERERSAASHAITLHKPIRVRKLEPNWYIMNGTPADCTRFGVIALLKEKCDLVVSGINHGANLGADTMYSGTVGAAKEACMLGIPALAISVTTKEEKPHFDTAARFAVDAAREILARGLPKNTCLNVNVPNHPWRSLKGVSVTTLGQRIYGRALSPRVDPRGLTYYWMAGAVPRGVADPGSDIAAIEVGKISVTPLKLYLADEQFLPELRRWGWGKTKALARGRLARGE